jgi:hypothetical protein
MPLIDDLIDNLIEWKDRHCDSPLCRDDGYNIEDDNDAGLNDKELKILNFYKTITRTTEYYKLKRKLYRYFTHYKDHYKSEGSDSRTINRLEYFEKEDYNQVKITISYWYGVIHKYLIDPCTGLFKLVKIFAWCPRGRGDTVIRKYTNNSWISYQEVFQQIVDHPDGYMDDQEDPNNQNVKIKVISIDTIMRRH